MQHLTQRLFIIEDGDDEDGDDEFQYMQQRQSADTFIFPIVKAFPVSQNSPTNRGG